MSVKAIFVEHEVTITEGGTDLPVPFGPDALGDASAWIPCGPVIRASLTGTIGASGTDITVNGKRTLNAPSETVKASATYSTGTQNVLDRQNVEGFAYIQVKSNGTDTEATSLYLVLK